MRPPGPAPRPRPDSPCDEQTAWSYLKPIPAGPPDAIRGASRRNLARAGTGRLVDRKPGAFGDGGGLYPAGRVKLAKDVAYVDARGARAYEQRRRDLRVGFALPD